MFTVRIVRVCSKSVTPILAVGHNVQGRNLYLAFAGNRLKYIGILFCFVGLSSALELYLRLTMVSPLRAHAWYLGLGWMHGAPSLVHYDPRVSFSRTKYTIKHAAGVLQRQPTPVAPTPQFSSPFQAFPLVNSIVHETGRGWVGSFKLHFESGYNNTTSACRFCRLILLSSLYVVRFCAILVYSSLSLCPEI